ncbi:hypothetical protein [Paludibacterium denitrificans]|uniref:hypothetical protein n=1 Tax=Paludibacterium denitrificans TaxID=2675226 RepID=UPI001E47707A|nr:hypothetical protein [Paludibacterium denitrificans]
MAVQQASGLVCINLVMIRGGRHLGDKSFFPSNSDDSDVSANLEAFLAQHYLGSPLPPVIIINGSISDVLKEYLEEQAERSADHSQSPHRRAPRLAGNGREKCRIGYWSEAFQQIHPATPSGHVERSLAAGRRRAAGMF